MKNYKWPLTSITLLFLTINLQAQATTLSFGYNISFGAQAPTGPTPYATAIFDDQGSPGSVLLTMNVASTVGNADVSGMYFSINPTLNASNLVFSNQPGTGPAANSINTGTNAFQADGDGKYDIFFNFPPPPGNNRFEAGETVSYEISGIAGLTANDFNFLAAPGGGNGPFYSVARFISTPNGGSDWVGANEGTVSSVPLPSAVWLMTSGLITLIGTSGRKKHIA